MQLPSRLLAVARRLAALVWLALVAAPVAMALGQFDGVYGGIVTIARNNGRIGLGEQLCSVSAVRATWPVVDNNIELSWQGSDWRVPVRPDGTISSSTLLNGITAVSASGKITGNAMILFYGTEACGYRFEGFRGG